MARTPEEVVVDAESLVDRLTDADSEAPIGSILDLLAEARGMILELMEFVPLEET